HGAFAGPAGAGRGPREARLSGGRSSGGGDHGATCARTASISYHRAFAPAHSHHSSAGAAASSRTPRRGAPAAVLVCLALLLTALALTSPAEAKKVPKGFFGIAPGV